MIATREDLAIFARDFRDVLKRENINRYEDAALRAGAQFSVEDAPDDFIEVVKTPLGFMSLRYVRLNRTQKVAQYYITSAVVPEPPAATISVCFSGPLEEYGISPFGPDTQLKIIPKGTLEALLEELELLAQFK